MYEQLFSARPASFVKEVKMPAGRPPKGARLVEALEGSARAKRRLRVILETITGTRTVRAACEELAIGEAAFHKLRARTLQEAVEGLEPRPLGRPAAEQEETGEVAELEAEIKSLRRELEAARIREELAVALPQLSKSRKKGRRSFPK